MPDLSRVPHVNQRPAPWQPEPVVVQAPRERRFPAYWKVAALGAAVMVGALAYGHANGHTKSGNGHTSIPDRGQLIQAAAAYSANQADAGGLTVTRTRVIDERLLPDGRAIVRLEVWTAGGTQNHFMEWVTLKRHLWISQDYRLCPVRPGKTCR